jgi:hypothetical protein
VAICDTLTESRWTLPSIPGNLIPYNQLPKIPNPVGSGVHIMSYIYKRSESFSRATNPQRGQSGTIWKMSATFRTTLKVSGKIGTES